MEPLEEEEGDDDDEDEENLNSVYEGLDLDDPYFREMLGRAAIDKETIGMDFFDDLNAFAEDEEYSMAEDLKRSFATLKESREDRLL